MWNTARLLELDPGARPILGKEVGSAALGRISVAGFAVLALLALAGAFTRTARRAPYFVWLVPLVLWLGTVPFAVNFSRFRSPLDPFAVLLAALAVASAAEGIHRRASRTTTTAAAEPSSAPATTSPG